MSLILVCVWCWFFFGPLRWFSFIVLWLSPRVGVGFCWSFVYCAVVSFVLKFGLRLALAFVGSLVPVRWSRLSVILV